MAEAVFKKLAKKGVAITSLNELPINATDSCWDVIEKECKLTSAETNALKKERCSALPGKKSCYFFICTQHKLAYIHVTVCDINLLVFLGAATVVDTTASAESLTLLIADVKGRLAKKVCITKLEELPISIVDPTWEKIKEVCSLTLKELIALKNERYIRQPGLIFCIV